MEKNYVVLSMYVEKGKSADQIEKTNGWIDIFGPFTKEEAQLFANEQNAEASHHENGNLDYVCYCPFPMLTATTDFKRRNFEKDGTPQETIKAVCELCDTIEIGEGADLNIGSGWHRQECRDYGGRPNYYMYLCPKCIKMGFQFELRITNQGM